MANNPYVNKVQKADGTVIIDISDTTAIASDVASGKYFYTAAGEKVQGTASGAAAISVVDELDSHGGTIRHINGVSLQGDTVAADKMLSGITAHNASGTAVTGSIQSQAAQTIHPSSSDQTIASGKYLSGAQTIKGVLLTNLSAANIKKDVVVKVGDSTDDDCVTSVTGTYEGGSAKNFQVSNTQVRLGNKTALTDTGLTLTVAETGTYNVYWSAFRSNTSSGYTWGTQLYIGSSSYGSENTSWSNSYNQINKLTGVSLTKNQVLHIYGRTRSGSSYYVCCSNLIIEQTA